MVKFPIARLKDGLRLYDVEKNDLVSRRIETIEWVIQQKLAPSIRKEIQVLPNNLRGHNEVILHELLKKYLDAYTIWHLIEVLQQDCATYYEDYSTDEIVDMLKRNVDVRGIKLGNKGKIAMADDTFALSKIPSSDRDKSFVLVQKMLTCGTEVYKGVNFGGESGQYSLDDIKKLVCNGYLIAGVSLWSSGKIKVYKGLPIEAV